MKTIVLSIVSVFTALFGVCQMNAGVTVSSYVTDKYLGFSTGNMLSNDPAVQTEAFIGFDSGLYVDFFHSRSLKGQWNDGSLANELDYCLGWNGKIGKGLSLNVGSSYFDESKTLSLGAGDILKSWAILSKTYNLATVSLGLENFTTMPNSGFHGGNMVTLGVSRSVTFVEGRMTLKGSAIGVYDFGTLGSGAGVIARGNIGLDWNLSKKVTLNVLGVNWFIPITPHDKRVTNAMVFVGATFKVK